MKPARAVVVLAAALVLAACGGPVGNLDVHDATLDVPAAAIPPVRPVLHEATWPEAAAWIERNADLGQPTVVNFFASWCAPCRAEAPLLRRAIEQTPGVNFLGVSHEDLMRATQSFLRDNGLGDPEGPAGRILLPTLFDPEGRIAPVLGARGLPYTAFFDHTGRLVAAIDGILTEQALAQHLADLQAAAEAARG